MAISGAHVIVYSANAGADREFFRDVLEYPYVDAGGDWLIFRLPPAEVAIHPSYFAASHELYLMCDDLSATIRALRSSGVDLDEIEEACWGRVTRFRLPGGSAIGLYEPFHPRATEL